MYYSHTTTTIALRAKWSFLQYNDFGFRAQSNPGTCIACSQSSLYVSSRNPRFYYYGYLLKKSPNFCQFPRRVVTFRVCEESERFCKCRCFENDEFDVNFVEKDGIYDRTRRNFVKYSAFFDDSEDSGDEYRKYCKKERSYSEKRNLVVKSGDGKKWGHDFRRHEDGRKFSKRLNNEVNKEVYHRGVRDEDESNVSGNNSSSLRDFEDRRVENVRKYANNGSFNRDSKNDRNRRFSDRRYRDEEDFFLDNRKHTSNKKNSTLSVDFENDGRDYSSKKNSNLSSNFEGKRVVGNNKGYGIERVDEEEKVVREIQKNKDDETSFESGSRKETSMMKGFDRKIIEGDEKASYSFRNGSDRNARKEEYVYNEQEDSRKLIKSRRDDRYNRSSTVKESIGDLRRESYLHSQPNSEMRCMDKGESPTSYMERQSEVDKPVIRQADFKKSLLHSNNDVNKATSLTSVKNSVDVTRDKRTRIDESQTDKVNVNKLYETYNDDFSIRNANTSTSHIDSRREKETILRSHSRVEDETIRKDSIASSVENQIRRDVINEMETIEQYTNQTNASVIYSSGTERSNSGNTQLEIREDELEECSTSKFGSSESGFRRNDSERVSNLLESTIRTKNQQEASSFTTMHKNNNNKEKRLQFTAQVGTSSSVDQYKNDAIESARRLDESSSMYVEDFVNNLTQEASASDNHETTSTVRYESEKQSTLRYRNKGPSDEMWEIRGTTSMESSKTEEAKNSSSNSEVDNVDTTAKVVPSNVITRRAHKSLWTYIADIMKIGLGHRSDTSTQKSRRSSSNESVSSEAYFSGEELDEDKDSTEKDKSFDRSTHVSREDFDRSNITIEQPLLPLRRKKSPLLGDIGKDNVHVSGSPESQEELEKQIIARTSERRDDELEKTRSGPNIGGLTSIPIIRSTFSSRGGDMSQGQQEQRSSTVTASMTPPSVPEIESIHMPSSELPKLEETTNKEESEGEMNRRKLQRSKQVMTTQEESGSTSIPIIRSTFSSRGGDMSQGQQEQRSSTVTAAMTPPSVPEIESIHMPSSELPKLEETTNKEESEGGIDRRKLQRSKQVMTTQFEEWEEAYKREREQRLVDELFMREALLEAKKAADSWEVPVGAVLVQNGKIIARGCNLVEELRDSTAHAEMICIRQASNVLKSWRLAETTLYVTLEPCAMCAGAILQARVDTVVWGAPNKLLGADGSWVRLFPNGDEGTSSNSSNSMNQNVGPVHPFHPKITIRRGILATDCSDTMQQFFQLRRTKKVKKQEPPPPPPRIPILTAPVKLLGRFHNLLAAMFCL